MKKNVVALVSLGLMSMLAGNANAQVGDHILVAPRCLLKELTSLQTITSLQSFSLISANDNGVEALTQAKSHRTPQPCGGFMDVTESWKEYGGDVKNTTKAREFLAKYLPVEQEHKGKNYAIKYKKQTNRIIKTIDSQAMWADLTTLTSFPDRSGRTDNGVKAAAWIKQKVEEMAKAAGHSDVTVYYVPTGGGYLQPSVVAKLGNSDEAGVVIGGHMDTLSSTYELKPGADDDGSGTVTVLGVTRAILNSGVTFKRPIYFVWYAAEEAGLVGSTYVVRNFKKNNVAVDAVIQFDMTGYQNKNDPTMWLIQDNIDRNLTDFLGELINNYVKVPVNKTRCGYACSDHASWDQAGYTAAFPFEAAFGTDDPYIHTSRDKMDVLSLDHITNFAKLGTAFAVELAEPQS